MSDETELDREKQEAEEAGEPRKPPLSRGAALSVLVWVEDEKAEPSEPSP